MSECECKSQAEVACGDVIDMNENVHLYATIYRCEWSCLKEKAYIEASGISIVVCESAKFEHISFIDESRGYRGFPLVPVELLERWEKALNQQ